MISRFVFALVIIIRISWFDLDLREIIFLQNFRLTRLYLGQIWAVEVSARSFWRTKLYWGELSTLVRPRMQHYNLEVELKYQGQGDCSDKSGNRSRQVSMNSKLCHTKRTFASIQFKIQWIGQISNSMYAIQRNILFLGGNSFLEEYSNAVYNTSFNIIMLI